MRADIDIDLADRDKLLQLMHATPARQLHQGQVRRHNSGVYATDIPYDPVNACAAIDYETAEQLGYFKIDLLNMSVYQLIKSPGHYEQLLAQEPPWSRLWTNPEWTKQLVHVGNYTELLKILYPGWPHLFQSSDQARHICRIGPGKRYLPVCGTATIVVDSYLKSPMLSATQPWWHYT